MINNNNPCFHCTERFIGCHSVCQAYIDWDKENKAFNERQHRERDLHNFLVGMDVQRNTKGRKKK